MELIYGLRKAQDGNGHVHDVIILIPILNTRANSRKIGLPRTKASFADSSTKNMINYLVSQHNFNCDSTTAASYQHLKVPQSTLSTAFANTVYLRIILMQQFLNNCC